MEWSAKWDCESLVMFSSKTCESPNKLQLTDWEIVEEGELDAGSFNLSGEGGGGSDCVSGVYCSDAGQVYSTKGSISASSDSSSKDEMKASNFTFEVFEDSPGEFDKKMDQLRAEVHLKSPLDTSVCSVESLIGLKLGKRTYFENNNVQSSSSMVPVSSAPISKRTKPSSQGAQISRCRVEGCNLDLSSAKQYHQKHRVCDKHSKCPKVIVGGVERRFCQQCSRFHSLSEFDEKKRSCRRRLSDHNARRRCPRQESIQFNSTRLSPFIYDDRQQMNFVLNQVPLVHSKTAADSTWDTYSSRLTSSEEFTSEPGKTNINRQSYISGILPPNATSMHGNAWNWPLTSKGTTAEVFNQALFSHFSKGAKRSMFPSNVGTIQEFARALSLLSTPSRGSFEPKSISSGNPVHENQSSFSEPMLHAIPQGLPLASSDYWQASTNFHGQTLVANTNNGSLFSEIQLFKALCDRDFCFNALT